MNVFKQKEREFALGRLPALKEKFPESSQILDFLSCILEYQNLMIVDLSESRLYLDTFNAQSRVEKGKPAFKLKDLDLSPFLKYLYPLLEKASECGTPEIEKGSEYLRSLERDELLSLINYFLESQMADDVSRLLFISFLQPIMYVSADRVNFEQEKWLKNHCPVCGFKPSVSFLMDTEEWEGARFLRCSLCLTDWLYVRTKCVNCGNVEDDKLDYFTSPDINYIDIQTCKKCNHYIKIVDLRKEGLAVPDLEDIASVSLDLWAQDQGFVKFERNLFGF